LGGDDAADVSQTVWLKLIEHLDDIREPRALPGWIATTTRNEAFRLLKSRQRTIAVDPLTGFGFDDLSDPGSLDEAVLRDERHHALREGLRDLRPEHRDLLLLLLVDPPLSYDDISQRLGIPRGSIGPTRARCLDTLRNSAALRAFFPVSESA
jgi:RNA polymerase sigma factor (sigma-70 family)